MVETQLNIFDSVVLVVLFLSTLMAFFRGFVKEVLSLGAWIGSAVITLYWFPSVAELLKPHFKNQGIAAGFAAMGTYATALVSLSIVNMVIIRYLKSGSDVGLLDNMLGLVFGFARGAFIVSLGFLLMTFVMSEKNYPEWVAEARTREYVAKGADILAQVAPTYLEDSTRLSEIFGTKPSEDDIEADGEKGKSLFDFGGSRKDTRDSGYTNSQLKELNRLIDSHAPERPTAR